MKIVVAITAASGSIYARQVVELLCADSGVSRVALLYSGSAAEVCSYEGVTIPEDEKIERYNNDDLFAPIASGSAGWDAMIVVPCSVGSLARIASGVSDSLISRAADVMLKERRRLILVVREMPLSLIHLRNMTAVTEAGAIILPASPNFYMGASSVEEVALTVSRRAVDMAGCEGHIKRWEGKNCKESR